MWVKLTKIAKIGQRFVVAIKRNSAGFCKASQNNKRLNEFNHDDDREIIEVSMNRLLQNRSGHF